MTKYKAFWKQAGSYVGRLIYSSNSYTVSHSMLLRGWADPNLIIYLRKLCPQQQSRKGLLSTPEASERESDLEEWGPVTSEPSVTQIEPQIPEVNTKPKRFKTWILSNRPFERYQYFILHVDPRLQDTQDFQILYFYQASVKGDQTNDDRAAKECKIVSMAFKNSTRGLWAGDSGGKPWALV